MHHFFEAITNTSGQSLVGYFARVIDPATQAVVPIASDGNGTPIITVSGVANMAKTDEAGNLSFFVEPGTYHLDLYQPDASTFLKRVPNLPMNSQKGEKGDPGDQGAPGPADNTYTSLSDLAASEISRKAASLAAAAGQAGIRYYWTEGDFTGKVDGTATVASTNVSVSQGAWVDPLRQPTGFTLVKYKRSEAGTFARTAQQLERIGGFDGRIPMMHWVPSDLDEGILSAGNGVPVTQYLQAAFNQSPIDRPMIFPPGEIRTDATVYNPRVISMHGNGCIWRGYFGGDTASDMLSITANRDSRGFVLDGFQYLGFSFGGRHAVFMDSDGASKALIGFIIRNCLLAGNNGNGLRLAGLGTHLGHVTDCNIVEGIYATTADNNVYSRNIIFGLKTAITLDLIGGAFSTSIINNALVARDGGVNVANGDNIIIRGNQIEQFAAYGANQAPFGSQVLVYPQARRAHGILIKENNFGGGSNCAAPITALGTISDLVIGDNQFLFGATGFDVRLLTADTIGTRIGANIYRGDRPSSLAGAPLALFDGGTATRGYWKDAAGITFANGWSAGTDFGRELSASQDEMAHLTGSIIVGTSTAVGDIVATLPEGYKPRQNAPLICANGADNNVVKFMIEPSGTMKVAGPMPAAGTSIYLPGGGYRARSRDTIDTGVL